MTHRLYSLPVACLALLVFTGIAAAQAVPYQPQYGLGESLNRTSAHIVMPIRLHPEVEVSRTLAAQPVHPHMVKVLIGGETISSTPNVSANISTYIDPMRRLDGDGGLDENHSLVKAQRLYLSLSGTTTEQLNTIRAHSEQLRARQHTPANRAYLVVAPPRPEGVDDLVPEPIMIIPVPSAPRPVEPADTEGKLVARADVQTNTHTRPTGQPTAEESSERPRAAERGE
jgi:hypothetical protein